MYIFTQLLLHLVPLALLLAATAAGRPAAVNPSAAQPARRQVIISTDPGIDDTIALLLAVASPELELRAVCVDFGSLHNVSQYGCTRPRSQANNAFLSFFLSFFCVLLLHQSCRVTDCALAGRC